jgi:hypothetical protein
VSAAPREDLCSLPVAAGTCEENLPRWYFDEQTLSCRRFTFTGCKGNANQFEDHHACEEACQPKLRVCAQPRETGPGKAHFTRWAYEPEQNRCVEFVWGGVGGTENNFETHDECEEACKE